MSDMLWTAPEILVERNKAGETFVAATQAGDVYSFAIIVQEILYCNGPFWVCEDQQPSPKGFFHLLQFRCYRYLFESLMWVTVV